ncbi:hypothetical protein [Burkholderia gladioli]|uniref:Uncharacterized protein n=1 Tax=Burkholderia gladioli TaxID=28095 RepID=A0AB38TUP9_BURGA|nr:hypothetical protein [Burkholderia gladioli]MBU9275328.1 hypothetical protein [Burkholderia gladioli]MBU9684558.1 hypothetical protein [Burkholderia gladioli]MCA8169701.1 hypothetical protein [Burkholderia gladioli]MDN7718215.1 hypothetical protein [Burkholderia gladioli]UWX71395.1 hypothetical protein NYZ96_06490 [Burkholderia gladioli]
MIAIVCLVVGAAIVQANAQAANCVVAPFRRAAPQYRAARAGRCLSGPSNGLPLWCRIETARR